ncbi:LacI family transcriptional regulator [Rariglobus hedericola]|uniref:LacI family transcriptional regulator n=1 Tax=Rariglobus hedericola TaxID=2597822 RepID=A0A556QSW0_9BACT|nr:LacI family transcriptional regulator [Rariglobus hedericola]
MRVTLKDVAKQSGLGLGTVSRAMADKFGVAPATRARVLAAARELGYRPNAAARALAGQRLHLHQKDQILVAFLRHESGVSDAYFEQACANRGMRGLCVAPKKFAGPKAAARELYAWGVDALIVSPYKLAWTEADMKDFDWSLFSIVGMARDFRFGGFEIVRHHAFAYMHESLVKLRDAGFRRIQVILHRSISLYDDDERLGAALAFQSRNKSGGVRLRISSIDGDLDHESMSTAMDLLSSDWADVILFDHFAFIGRLRQRGGGDLLDRRPYAAVIAVDDSSDPYGTVSGCLLCDAQRFSRAVSACQNLIQTGRRGRFEHPAEHLIDPAWEVRQSLRRPA